MPGTFSYGVISDGQIEAAGEMYKRELRYRRDVGLCVREGHPSYVEVEGLGMVCGRCVRVLEVSEG